MCFYATAGFMLAVFYFPSAIYLSMKSRMNITNKDLQYMISRGRLGPEAFIDSAKNMNQ